jgi:dolichyl-phosphate-mannose-protein mannosyltransferase
MKGFFKGDRGAVIGLMVLFVAVEILINPIGEFPLNDDWSYTRSFIHLYNTNNLRLGGFTSMPLVAQLLWAWTFCKIFGFSFTLLRISTLVLALAGILSSYLLIRELSGNRKVAITGALVVLFNPIFLNLSNTYMTDVPFMAMLLCSLLCFVKGMRRDQLSWIVGGMLFVILATMIRQLGLLAALSFSFCYLFLGGNAGAGKGGDSKPQVGSGQFAMRLMVSGCVFLVPLVIYLSFNYWLKKHSVYPAMYDEGTKQIFYHLFYADYSTPVFLIKQVFHILIYCGFFIFPFILLYNQGLIQRKVGKLFYYYLFFILLVTGYFLVFKRMMPYTGNILNIYGSGIATLRDVMILKLAHLAPLPGILWVFITLAGAAGAGMLVFVVRKYMPDLSWRARKLHFNAPGEVLFLLCFLLLYLIVMVVGGAFDRYLIPVAPVCCALIGYLLSGYVSAGKVARRVVYGVLLVYGCFSVSCTSDYLSWNRARWEALQFLMREEHIRPEQIDGGFEFNGYYLYDDTKMDFQEDPQKKSWWWVKDDAYLISFGPVEGYRVMKEFGYRKFLHLSSGRIYILFRNPPLAGGKYHQY